MFAKFTDTQEAQVPWLIKSPAHALCPQAQQEGSCVEDEEVPFVVRGIAGLRRQFGKCAQASPNAREVLLERGVLRPLLVHSRRIKYHALLLVAAAEPPWEAYMHRGFVSLASPDARTEENDDFISSGAAVGDSQTLERETTDLRRQRQQRGGNLPGGTGLSLWPFSRFRQYLDSFGLCKNDRCGKLWKRAKAITRTLLEASIKHQEQAFKDAAFRASTSSSFGFQVFRVSFWIDEDLTPWLHRGSAQLDFLLDKYEPRVEWLEDSMADILAEAVGLATGLRNLTECKEWELLKDQYEEACGEQHAEPFDPCRSVPAAQYVHTPAAETSSKKQEHAKQEQQQPEHVDAQQARKDQVEQSKGHIAQLYGSDKDAGMRITGPGELKFSPKKELDSQRRAPHVPLDEL